MIEVGHYQELEVVKKVSFGLYLGSEDGSVLLPRKWVPAGARVGDRLRVFVYHDSEGKPIATTMTPHATLGEIAVMKVVDVSRHGAFVDWGLEKDLFVAHREQQREMVIGSRHAVAVCIDEQTGRLMGSSRLSAHFETDVASLREGQEVGLVVYGTNDFGAQVVVDRRYSGLLYHSELFQKVRVGDELDGYVVLVRDDHKIDVRLRKPGRSAELDAQAVILGALEAREDGFLPLHDKSPPAEIHRQLGMSKKVFKAGIGGLYKSGRIDLLPEGIRLREATS